MDVVQHDDQSLRLGDGREETAHQVEEPKPSALRLPVLARWKLRDTLAQHREDVCQLAAPGTSRGGNGFVPDLIYPPPQCHVPGPERGCRAVLPAASPPYRHAVRLGLPGDDARETGLADPWLAAEQHDASVPGERGIEGSAQLPDLMVTIDQWEDW